MNELEICCRICGCSLCDVKDFIDDEVNNNAACGSYFLDSPVCWMEEAASSIEGKLFCPKCSGRVGRISWVGFEAINGRWISPAIMITKSRSDVKRKDVVDDTVVADKNETDAPKDDREAEEKAQNGTNAFSDVDHQDWNGIEVVEKHVCEERNIVDQLKVDDFVDQNDDSVELATSSNGCDSDEEFSHDEDLSAHAQLLPAAAAAATGTPKTYTRDELATMDMLELVRLLDSGDIEMDELVAACDAAAARAKENAERQRDLTKPQVVMAAVKQQLDTATWQALREHSGRLRRGETGCGDYYAAFADVFARLDAHALFRPLVALLPDEDKRQELLALHASAAAAAAAAPLCAAAAAAPP